MISHIDIATTKNYELNEDIAKYIQKKVGKLDRHLKRKNREEARADVKLKENNGKADRKYTCEVLLHIPGLTLTASESTMNMFAAVDIVEQKLQKQLRRHKEKHSKSSDKHKNSRARQAVGKMFRKN